MFPQPGPEIPNSLNDPYIISIARGLPKLPQSGAEVANSPNDFYALCMTFTRPHPFLSA